MRVRLGVLALMIVMLLLPAVTDAETIDVSDNHGGRVADYDTRWAGLAGRGVRVRVVGPCQSACTVLLGHIPRRNICVTPRGAFGFHTAHRADATATLWAAYASDIKQWIEQHGGLKPTFIWMRAPDTYRFFKRC